MKKILLLCMLATTGNPSFAQPANNVFMDPEVAPLAELIGIFNDGFVKTSVSKISTKGKFFFNYKLEADAIIIYRHTVFGTSAVDATYEDKWFYIPLNDLYVNTKDTLKNVFVETAEIALTNKQKAIRTGNGKKYDLTDKDSYLQNEVNIPFLLGENTVYKTNPLKKLDAVLPILRKDDEKSIASGQIPATSKVEPKTAATKPIIKKEYYSSGELQSEIPYVNDKKEGKRKYYYTSGELRAETVYINDKEEGISKIYYKTGEVEYETPYAADKKDGIEKRYYRSGKLKSTMGFKMGKANGTTQEFYETGTIKSRAETLDGRYNGYFIKYDEEGNIKEKKAVDTWHNKWQPEYL